MSANSVPRFAEEIKTWKTQVSVANANISGNTGTLSTLVTGKINEGSKVDYFLFQAQSATQVNRIRLYLFTSNSTPHLFKEIQVTSASAHDAQVTMWSGSYTPAVPIFVPSEWTLQVSIDSANTINVFAFGGNY